MRVFGEILKDDSSEGHDRRLPRPWQRSDLEDVCRDAIGAKDSINCVWGCYGVCQTAREEGSYRVWVGLSWCQGTLLQLSVCKPTIVASRSPLGRRRREMSKREDVATADADKMRAVAGIECKRSCTRRGGCASVASTEPSWSLPSSIWLYAAVGKLM